MKEKQRRDWLLRTNLQAVRTCARAPYPMARTGRTIPRAGQRLSPMRPYRGRPMIATYYRIVCDYCACDWLGFTERRDQAEAEYKAGGGIIRTIGGKRRHFCSV